MLIIRRRAGESLFIGDDVEIHVLEVAPSYVKLGIEAPREVPVLREEIYLTATLNRSAAGLAGASVPILVESLRAGNSIEKQFAEKHFTEKQPNSPESI